MKFSVNWLREFVELPASTEALAELLTMSGIEIEAIEKRGGNFDKVVVAQIKESKQHPNADRLTVCAVDDGSGKARQIVCGATNYKVGDKVPLALPGAELPEGLKIRASKLRGIESEGMLCSAKELGLGQDASGLLILTSEAKVGAPIGEVFPRDTIFDVEITPNRGDLLSHLGLAREIAALTTVSSRGERSEVAGSRSAAFKVTSTGSLDFARDDREEKRGVTISAPQECPFYSVRRIENVKVGPSPGWLRAKIESVGIRSINNIVDISNFVMLELGQPTHAFDAAKLGGGINVRLAREGEKFLALDGRTYSLRPDNLMIADAERAVGIAGVMGGEESGVSGATTTVLLESAYFSPSSIRGTARDLNLPSDASYRFERGVDPQTVLRASQRVTDLICEIAGGKAAEATEVAGELPPRPADVALRYERLDALLGTHIKPEIADGILARFGLEKVGQVSNLPTAETTKLKTCSTWRIPSYRRDLRHEVDLIEEVARGFGIEKIPSTDRSRFTPASEADRAYDFETELGGDLVGLGLNETRTPALISRNELSRTAGAVTLRNPLSQDHVALRTSLIPGLLDAVSRNIRGGAERIALFEIGNVFVSPAGEQKRMLALALNGLAASRRNWRGDKERRLDFFDLKGMVESLRAGMEWRQAATNRFALAAELYIGEKRLGICAQIALAEASELGAVGPVLVGEIDVVGLARTRRRAASFSEIERYPSVRRDIAMFVASKVGHEEIMRAIASAREPLLEGVELFDLFSDKKSESAGEARKSLAYSLTYRAKNRTLTNEEVSAAHARIRERLRKEIDADLRE
jgi:phenylalanyl-tRNA synthetase beta chain